MQNSVKFYYLDISNVFERPDVFDGVDIIPLVTGRHVCRFDVLEDELPTDKIEKIRQYRSKEQKLPGICKKNLELETVESLPLGLDLIPAGGILTDDKGNIVIDNSDGLFYV